MRKSAKSGENFAEMRTKFAWAACVNHAVINHDRTLREAKDLLNRHAPALDAIAARLAALREPSHKGGWKIRDGIVSC